MVTTSILIGTAATFFSLGGVFCLYIHSVSKLMRRSYSEDLKCGESGEKRACCQRDKEHGEVNCFRDGLCGNKPRIKKRKQSDDDENNDYTLSEKEFSLDGQTSNLSYDKTEMLKDEEQDTIAVPSNTNRESMEIEEMKIVKEDYTNLENAKPKERDITIEDPSREEDRSFSENTMLLSEIEKLPPEQEQQNDRPSRETTQKPQELMSKSDEKKRKRQEKEAKKLQRKQLRKTKKEDKKKAKEEKKKISKERKEVKALKKIKELRLTKKKIEQKNALKEQNEMEDVNSKGFEQANLNYQKIKDILTGIKNKH